MPDFSGFGRVPGTEYMLGQQQQQLNALTIQARAEEIAAQPLHLDLLRGQIADTTALTRGRTAEARLNEMKADEQQRASEIMRQSVQKLSSDAQTAQVLDPNGPDPQAMGRSMATQQLRVANMLAKGGAPMAAQTYAKNGLDMLTKITQADANLARQRNSATEAAMREVELTSQYLGSAKNAQEFEAGKVALMAAMPQMPAADRQRLLSTAYSPDVIQHLNDQALKESDRRKLEQQKTEQVSKDTYRRSREWALSWDRSEANIRRREEIRRDVAAQKAGDKPMKDINPKQLERVRGAISREMFPGQKGITGDTKEQLDAAAVDAVGQVQALMRSNKGLTESEATARVVAAQKREWTRTQSGGALGLLRDVTLGAVDLGKTKTVYGLGRSADKPIPAQPGQEFVEGKYYVSPAGKVAKRVKGGWEAAKPAGRPVDIPPPVDEESDDADE